MELELILTELQPFKLSHFRHFFALYGVEFLLGFATTLNSR